MRFFWVVLLLGAIAGCEATEEDIERWKSTQRGPAKITAVVVDNAYSYEMRGRAAIALVEITRWANLEQAFERLSEDDRRGIIHSMVPRLEQMYTTGLGGEATDSQVIAKDAMHDLYDWAGPDDQAVMRRHLIDWVTTDFNKHYLPGRRNIGLIVGKVGAPAATALAKTLTPENALISFKAAELIRDHGDEESKQAASKALADIGTKLGDQTRVAVWQAMAIICGEPVREFAVKFAKRRQGNVEAQLNALICVMEGAPPECRPGCVQQSDIHKILDVAEDEQQDERIRAAAYDSARKSASKAHLERFLKMLEDEDIRYRATGVDLAVQVGKAKAAVKILELLGDSRVAWSWKQEHRELGEYGFCNMGLGQLDQADGIREEMLASLSDDEAFVRGGAANILGIVGTAEDVPRLEALTSDRGKLRGWEPDSVGAQARQAIERIRASDRGKTISARRGKACGL